jgi:NTP pyrophosphatase (non-canonical NTP hydrolase)
VRNAARSADRMPAAFSPDVPMTTLPLTLDALRAQLRAFVAERDWDQFHNPKNLAMAVVVEAGELVEQFQWLTPEQSEQLAPQTRTAVEMEVADVLLFLLRLCDRLDIDPLRAAQRKLALNAQKYPVDKARGRADKYDRL